MRAGARAAPGPGPALALGSPRIRPARQGRRVRCHRGWSSLKDGRSSDTCALRRARGPRAARPLRIPAAQLLGASEASRSLVRKSRVLPTRRPSQGTFRQAPGRRAGTRARTGGGRPQRGGGGREKTVGCHLRRRPLRLGCTRGGRKRRAPPSLGCSAGPRWRGGRRAGRPRADAPRGVPGPTPVRGEGLRVAGAGRPRGFSGVGGRRPRLASFSGGTPLHALSRDLA